MNTLTPRRLTEHEIKEAFPDALPIINAKIRERKAERREMLIEIRDSLKLSRGYDETTREVWTEWIKLLYGPKLDAIDSHLWRLKGNRANLRGKSPHPDMITTDMIERAKEFPIESFADMELRKYGKRSRGLCPFHQEKTPSFFINQNNTFHCFGCGKGGDSIEFSRLKYGHTFPEAVRNLSGRTT